MNFTLIYLQIQQDGLKMLFTSVQGLKILCFSKIVFLMNVVIFSLSSPLSDNVDKKWTEGFWFRDMRRALKPSL